MCKIHKYLEMKQSLKSKSDLSINQKLFHQNESVNTHNIPDFLYMIPKMIFIAVSLLEKKKIIKQCLNLHFYTLRN
jgi:hypothetical protein